MDPSAKNLPPPFVVLPQPQNVILLKKDRGLERDNLQQVLLKGDFKRPVMGPILSQLPAGQIDGKGTLVLVLDKTAGSIPSDEGYVITVMGNRVEVIAR